MRNILIALDESEVSLRAAREAVRLFGRDESHFHIVNVARIPVPWVGAAGFGTVGPLPMDARWASADIEAERQALAAEERDLTARVEDAGIPDADTELRTGDPVREVCAAAEEHDVDVIVVGSHDKSGLRRLFDPSVADGIVHTTHRPVLVVSGTAGQHR